jgi:hypothetical protein
MRTPSLLPQIRDDLKAIAKAVITEESDYVERQWQEIVQQIEALARSARAESNTQSQGFRVCINPEFIECINCGQSGPAGRKACDCGQRFRKVRAA